MVLLNANNIPKFKWDGAEEPTINNFYTTDDSHFEYALKVRLDLNRSQ